MFLGHLSANFLKCICDGSYQKIEKRYAYYVPTMRRKDQLIKINL